MSYQIHLKSPFMRCPFFMLLLAASQLSLAQTGLPASPKSGTVSAPFALTVLLTDAVTHAPVPFMTGFLKVGRNGDAANENGVLVLTVKQLPDTLLLTEVGYEPRTLPIVAPETAPLLVLMQPTTGQLQEVTVTGYRDPGRAMMLRVIAHKRTNDPQRLARWTRNNYQRTEIDIENLSANQQRKLLSTLLKVYQQYNTDTTSANTLPIFFREQYFGEYHSRQPQNNAAFLIAEKNLGLQTDGLAAKTDRFCLTVNAYDAIIPLLKTSFVGPVSDLGLASYAYAPPDTLIENGKTTYRVGFKPRRANENTFTGSLWIDADSYALLRVAMTTSAGANLNFVQQLAIRQSFAPTDDGEQGTVWLLTESQLDYRFENGLGLLGLPSRIDSAGRTVRIINTNQFGHYQLNPAGITAVNFSVADQTPANTLRPFTDAYRLSPLRPREQAIYQAADSLKTNRRFQRTTRLAAFVASGYWDVQNKVRFGPYSSLLSANLTEGLRIRSGFWTMEGLDPRWCLWGYVAYGTRDRRFKETLGLKFVPGRSPYRKYELTLKNDYDALSQYDDQLDNDNLFTLALRKPIPVYQTFLRQIRLSHERDLSPNWSAKTYYTYGSLTPTFQFSYAPEEVVNGADSAVALLHTLVNSEVGLTLRYARNERTTILNYDKLRIYTSAPVVSLYVAGGVPVFNNTYFDYVKFSLSLSQDKPMPFKGSFYYNLTGGAVLGTVPLLLLHIPRGNPFYVADKYAFYGMSPYEFAADRYASLLTRYSLGGLILDKIPLLNKLNLRERVTANFFWGDMTAANREVNKVNTYNTTGPVPYAEAGVGIENIFNLFSIDCIWRLNHVAGADAVRITRFGIYTGLKLQF